MKKLIHDGDHGSDDFITTLLCLAVHNQFELLGVTIVHGNVAASISAKNALCACEMAGFNTVPVFIGETQAFQSQSPKGDDAFSSNGLGGVILEEPKGVVQSQGAVEWMIDTLENADEKITICATGPLTNIAKLIDKRPDLSDKIDTLVIMGGGLGEPYGNITDFSEFNFYMDPEAADFVLKTDQLNKVLFPLDCTHQMVFTPERQNVMREFLPEAVGEVLIPIMRAAEKLDIPKFNVNGAFVHDCHTILSLICPDLYEYQDAPIGVVSSNDNEKRGHCELRNDYSTCKIAKKITNVDDLYTQQLELLRNLNWVTS